MDNQYSPNGHKEYVLHSEQIVLEISDGDLVRQIRQHWIYCLIRKIIMVHNDRLETRKSERLTLHLVQRPYCLHPFAPYPGVYKMYVYRIPMNSFDYIIIGTGPAGLAAATALSKSYTVALLDRESSIGGCHRVRRDAGGYFGEHGPRVYSGAYVTVDYILRKIGTTWKDIFVPTSFSPDMMNGKRWYQTLSPREIASIVVECIPFFLWNPHSGSTESVMEFCKRNSFSVASIAYMDRICRHSDGAGADDYPLNTFLNGFNQHALYRFYSPKVPLDVSLFPLWHNFLQRTGRVEFYLGQKAIRLQSLPNGQTIVELSGHNKLHAKLGVICATPPVNLLELLKKSCMNIPKGFQQFAKDTEYNEYLSISFHFSPRLPSTFKRGQRTPWQIAYIPQFHGRILSTAAVLLDVPSPYNGKTAHECTRQELANEMLLQLSAATGIVLNPTRTVVSSGLRKHTDARWHDEDEAYVHTVKTGHWRRFKVSANYNVYTVGTHTGFSSNAFTSMESAVQNALTLVNTLHPDLTSFMHPKHNARTVRQLILFLITLVVIFFTNKTWLKRKFS